MKNIVVVNDIDSLGLKKGMFLYSKNGEIYEYYKNESEFRESGEKTIIENKIFSRSLLEEYIGTSLLEYGEDEDVPDIPEDSKKEEGPKPSEEELDNVEEKRLIELDRIGGYVPYVDYVPLWRRPRWYWWF